MLNSTITMALTGEVSLAHFAQAMAHFRGLVDALTVEISPDARIAWLVDDLEHDGAVATVRGLSPTMEAVEPVSVAYLLVGRALADGRQVPYSRRVASEAEALTKLLGGPITSIRFETNEDDVTIVDPATAGRHPPMSGAYGAVQGRVQALPSGDSLRFTLYDAVHNRAVACYLDESQQEMMRNVWDRRASVEGWVTRDTATGRPISIRRVRHITLLDEVVPGSAMRAARGIAPLGPDDPSAVEVIRRLRDDW